MLEAVLVLAALGVYLHRSRLGVAAAPPQGATRYGDDSARAALTVISVGLLLALPAGWLQTRPASATQVETMADYLARPAAHQVCEVHTGVRYCAYADHKGRIDEWREPVEATLARLPDAARGRDLVVAQRAEMVVADQDCGRSPYLDTLPEPVARRLSPEDMWSADGQVHPGFRWPEQLNCGPFRAHGLFLGVQTGAWAVGLPPAPWGEDHRCTADGQARALVALWLGTQTSPAAAETLGRLAAIDEDDDGWVGDRLTFDRWGDPPMWGVDWHRAEVTAALALLDQPAADVDAALAADWDRWVDPATPATDLLVQLGMAPPTNTPVPVGGDCP